MMGSISDDTLVTVAGGSCHKGVGKWSIFGFEINYEVYKGDCTF